MKPIIYIKYGELTLKGKNRNEFSKCLLSNIRLALKDIEIKITKQFDSMQLSDFPEDSLNQVIGILARIPGIGNFSVAYETDLEISNIIEAAKEFVNDTYHTFKIEARRSNKNYELNSLEIKQKIAGFILQNNPNIKVDVHKPELTIYIEIKQKNAIVHGSKITGFGGLPIKSSGKVLLLLSGGIDSPVAASLLMKRGIEVEFITFVSPPHTSPEALQKVRDLVKLVTLDGKLQKATLYVCNFTKLQHEITHIQKESYRITIMRRYFYKIAKQIAQENNCLAIATGEAIGQVASQTLQSMATISDVLNDFLILRPLVAYDKNEIINFARKINTYETSILPYDDSCSLFAPKAPATKPKLETAKWLEEQLELIEDIYISTLKNSIIKE